MLIQPAQEEVQHPGPVLGGEIEVERGPGIVLAQADGEVRDWCAATPTALWRPGLGARRARRRAPRPGRLGGSLRRRASTRPASRRRGSGCRSTPPTPESVPVPPLRCAPAPATRGVAASTSRLLPCPSCPRPVELPNRAPDARIIARRSWSSRGRVLVSDPAAAPPREGADRWRFIPGGGARCTRSRP